MHEVGHGTTEESLDRIGNSIRESGSGLAAPDGDLPRRHPVRRPILGRERGHGDSGYLEAVDADLREVEPGRPERASASAFDHRFEQPFGGLTDRFWFEELLDAIGTKFSAVSRLTKSTEGCTDVEGRSVEFDLASSQQSRNLERLTGRSRPDACSQPVWRRIGDANSVSDTVVGDDAQDWSEYLLLSNRGERIDVCEYSRAYVVPTAELVGPIDSPDHESRLPTRSRYGHSR